MLTLSDVHWASDEVLELCDRMLARLHHLPFVLVTTTRHDLDNRWTPESARCNTISLHLEPLDGNETAELVRALLCGEADDQMVTFLLERSGGNPFFVEELAAFVQDTHDASGLRELPATLHGLVAARLDALTPGERSVLEDCAVIGGSGHVSTVTALAGNADAVPVLERLAGRDLLHIERDEFQFKSELIREIAYGTLTKAERARRHAAVAPVLAAKGDAVVDQAAHHLATAAELVGELGPVLGVPADVRDQAVDALTRAAARDEEVELWPPAEGHHDRALGLLGSDPSPARRQAMLGRGRARIQQRLVDRARDDALTALSEARVADDRHSEAVALTLLGETEAAVGAYEIAEETFGRALDMWRELQDDSGAANVLRGLGMTHLFRGDLAQAERFVSEALGSFRSADDQRGAAWALQNLAWISFTHGDIPLTEKRLEESADLFGELGDWGGLGWAYGLLAFVRYNQGRLDEAAAIAEHIAIEGRETGNRWAVGMMDVLLANVALWSGRSQECVERGREAIALFQEIGDRWGEVMATGSTIRALAGLGRDAEYADCLTRFVEVSRQLPDENMQLFPAVVEACVLLQRGNADDTWRVLKQVDPPDDENLIGAADEVGAFGLAELQRGEVAEAIKTLEAPYLAADEDGPRMAIGCRLALAYAAGQRPDDARAVIDDLETRGGGTYSDRIISMWAQSLVDAQTGLGDARASIDAAHAIAAATDARLEHAIAALARAKVLGAIDDPSAREVADDARAQLESLGITGEGWARVFDAALSGAPAPDHR